MELKLALGECSGSFDMEKAVCNHGLFMMSPNVWIPSTKSLRRPLRLADSNRSVLVTISHPPNQSFLVIQADASLSSSADEAAILKKVGRMLRISKKEERDVREFQTMHSLAKERGFGRIFRSPSFFEDAVKSLLLCNCGWKRTLDMAKALCNLQREIALDNGKARSKRKRSTKKCRSSECIANFPTWKELVCWARVDAQYLEERCNIGYRAAPILRLVLMFANGKLDEDEITKLEQSSDPTAFQSLYQKLLGIKGFGPFVCSNILMCAGFYQRIPSDTETIRHLKQVHGKGNCSNNTIAKDVEEIYGNMIHFNVWPTGDETTLLCSYKFRMELVEEYESKSGKLSEPDASSYHLVTGSLFRDK
ncbi:Cation efflux family protein isoform 1 [Hibiscus syriacus]|uniref:Cation efflux family protein isoform 1 n=1 Tax=Hibiscus syriacus TaxID=106335 RepID=A0A6A2Y2Y2_HIBSY|nr:uncharacterized protein LOC120163553 [Hibiscus syriacus]KAE8677970.1 Cation efflux family protein isoform 1 [Hibiscus syriacus]